ncbi:hypothetical protein TrRE_jg10122, partial [Triparma retinervis]
KYLLNKGPSMLSLQYSTLSHHVTESMSELTYCLYLARTLPLSWLRRVVRRDFVPGHYSKDLGRLWELSPDELTRDFYDRPGVFKSRHPDLMGDIRPPGWCGDAEGTIRYHRSLLEGSVVSAGLHHWIDLNFGRALSGAEALRNKNIPLYVTGWGPGGDDVGRGGERGQG